MCGGTNEGKLRVTGCAWQDMRNRTYATELMEQNMYQAECIKQHARRLHILTRNHAPNDTTIQQPHAPTSYASLIQQSDAI